MSLNPPSDILSLGLNSKGCRNCLLWVPKVRNKLQRVFLGANSFSAICGRGFWGGEFGSMNPNPPSEIQYLPFNISEVHELSTLRWEHHRATFCKKAECAILAVLRPILEPQYAEVVLGRHLGPLSSYPPSEILYLSLNFSRCKKCALWCQKFWNKL